MDLQNLAYALTQVAHNFGAVTVVAGPLAMIIASRIALRPAAPRSVLWLVSAGWLVQIGSGILFGLVSFYSYGQLPDIHGVAIGALVIKMACAATAVLLALRLLLKYRSDDQPARVPWRVLAALGATALAAAAFLRWFS